MKILVPIDFSENSTKALDFVLAISKKEETSLILVNAIDLVFDFASQAELALESLFKDGESQMENLIKMHQASEIPMEYRVVEGTPAITVSRIAEEEEVDLIVMGTQGASGMKKTWIGTVTVNMIKESSVPVLVIPALADVNKVKKLSLALEFADHEEVFLDWVSNLAKHWNLGFEIVHVQTNTTFKEELTQIGASHYFAKRYPEGDTKVLTYFHENPSEGLQHVMEKEKDMILGMCHKHRNLWEQLTKKSHSIQMAYHTHVPLLVLV
jgi:nucleotide-binding universal stress UspA family protein